MSNKKIKTIRFAPFGATVIVPDEIYVDFKGYRFAPPFRCMCCGREVSAEQFAYGRTCALCDTGACNYASRNYGASFAHEHPPWWSSNPEDLWEQYVKAVGAKKID